MMFALLQEQHKAQMEAMLAANQKAMELMMERMNALVAGAQKGHDKENAPSAGNNNQSNGGMKCSKKNANTVANMSSTKQRTVTSLRPTPASIGQDGSWSRRPARQRPDRGRGHSAML